MAQLVKNLPAMRKTCVRSLDWEDPLEKGKAIHSNILAWRIHKELDTLSRFHFHSRLTNNVVIISGEQQRDSAIHTHVSISLYFCKQ